MKTMAQLLRKDRARHPGSWWPVVTPEGQRTAIVCCPACGVCRILGPACRVLPAGECTVSWACLAPGCGYEDWLILEGWGDAP